MNQASGTHLVDAATAVKKKNSSFEKFAGSLGTRFAVPCLQILAVAVFFALWQAAVQLGWVSVFLVGSPVSIYHAFERSISSGDLFVDTGYTVFEATVGFVIGTAIGSIVGLSLWYSSFVARVVEPFIVAVNSVPKVAFAPIVILWFGTGLTSKIVLAVSLTAIVALISAYEAAKDADVELQALLITLGARKRDIFFKVVVPSTLPYILSTFRINIGFGLVGAVVGEFISSEKGIGHMIYAASSLYDLSSVWAGLFVLMIVGFLMYFIIDAIERRLLPWRQSRNRGTVRV
ncbi:MULTISPECIES: ABC transporter permease [Burkholderiaceae]|uniref:Hydroxymethylpyrimidine ABC transporter, transmembrane component n=1 Tax=Caballeronia sordidicola TaxID=196367 RepID=A0A2C9XWV7_CABSO|nr:MULTISPECIES: ABC transporter permease [Burkholderiaceae]AME28108.1 ABC transporter permease [Burkholderia sp. PAMC 26561]OTP65989.1 Hydroxymethylpyrimidine ABC transporter, transmembrane component [Caballeronia sordidicola]